MLYQAQFWLAILLLGVIVAVYIWDATTLASGREDESVSVLIRAWSHKQPIVPFAFGVLIGHVFW